MPLPSDTEVGSNADLATEWGQQNCHILAMTLLYLQALGMWGNDHLLVTIF